MKTIPPNSQSVLAGFLFLILGTAALADGPPVDRNTGEVTAPHTLIDLSPSQVEELEVLDTVTFTPEQWAGLRKKAPSCGKRLDLIIPWDLNDCTCVLSNYTYGIALSRNRIAVVHGEWSDYWLATAMTGVEKDWNGICEFQIDRKGSLYFEGAEVSRELVLKALAETAGFSELFDPEKEPPFLAIRRPYWISREEPAIKDTIDTLYAAAEAAGWETMNKYERPKEKP